MDLRIVVEVAGTSLCGTVLGRTLEGSHGHPRFSFLFPTNAVSLPLLLLQAVTASYCSSNRDSAALAAAAVAAAVLAFAALGAAPYVLASANAPDAVIAVVAAAAIATPVCVVHSAAGAVGAADAVCAAFEIDEQCVWYCSSIVWLNCYYFL